jgi:hypothetical protein
MNKRYKTHINRQIVDLIVMNREHTITTATNSQFFAELDHMTRNVANRALKSTAQNQNKSSRLCDINVNKHRQEIFLIRANLFESASKRIKVDQAQDAIEIF